MSSTSEARLTWRIVSAIPGRMRLRHDAVGDRGRARRIEAELAATHGVIRAEARPLTSGLLVHYDQAAIGRRQLLRLLESLVEPGSSPIAAVEPPPARFAMATGSLALAATGELAVPALLPASAVLLVASSFKTLRQAWRDIRERRIGLPVLFATILTGTLLSGQFLAAALMGWMFQFWRHRHAVTQHELRRRLLPSITQRPRFARLCVGETEVEIPADRLEPGHRIVVEEGEIVPADGWLSGGFAVVDEGPLRGMAGLTRKEAGDLVFAGSRSAEGRLYVEVSAPGSTTRAAQLGRELASASHRPAEFALTAHGEDFARRAVAPTLVAAGFGLALGDLATASTILRPDYATGPGLGVSLESLQDIAESALDGVVIRDASVFHRIASADVLLLDDHPGLTEPGIAVSEVRGLDSTDESEILRLSAWAFAELADDRSAALHAACADRGIIVRRGARPRYRGRQITLTDRGRAIVLRDLREADPGAGIPPTLEVLLDGRPIGRIAFGRSPSPRAADCLRELRRHGALAIGLVSDRPGPETARLAAVLGADFHVGDLSPGGKADVVRSLRQRGRKVVYLADCRREPAAAREADVAISLADAASPSVNPAHIVVLRRDLGWIAPLRDRSRSHVERVRSVQRFILIPNLACIAGAFFLGFTSLAAVVLTNLGTLAVYKGLPQRHRLALPARTRITRV